MRFVYLTVPSSHLKICVFFYLFSISICLDIYLIRFHFLGFKSNGIFLCSSIVIFCWK
ncbi:hypothetical protein BD408DRAFT_410413 [Parasitella parasitica]|nr:hypothetical protein BD408DRAFT_410413 [Parasitella parasitica]